MVILCVSWPTVGSSVSFKKKNLFLFHISHQAINLLDLSRKEDFSASERITAEKQTNKQREFMPSTLN